MKNNFKTWFAMSMLAVLTAGLGVSMYQEYWPIKIIEIKTPVKVLTPKVKGGEIMVYLLDYCLYKSYPATVSRNLVDGTVIELPVTREVLPMGCHQTKMQVPIPSGSLPGIYRLIGIKSFIVTQTRKIDVPFTSVDFEIIK